MAEEALIGSMLMTGEAVELGLSVCGVGDFGPPRDTVFAAISALHARSAPVDVVTVNSEIDRDGLAELLPEAAATMMGWIAAVPALGHAAAYAERVAECAAARRLQGALAEAHQAVSERRMTQSTLVSVADALRQAESVNVEPAPDPNVDDFLAIDDTDSYDWIVPNVLERADRTILTAAEGGGKSTLLRQMAVQTAAGIHLFTDEHIKPMRVLYIDCENGERHIRRKLRPLRMKAGTALDPANLVVMVRSAGIDLESAADQSWLEARVAANRPDLLIIGPLYKLASGDPLDELVAKAVSGVLDHLRIRYGFALVVEAHSPHAGSGTKRPERPYGASLWMRWPEFGLHLADTGHLRHWRGDRDERDWPSMLKRGGQWPFMPIATAAVVNFARCMELSIEAGQVLSLRELAKKMGGHPEQISRAIKANQRQWDAMVKELTE